MKIITNSWTLLAAIALCGVIECPRNVRAQNQDASATSGAEGSGSRAGARARRERGAFGTTTLRFSDKEVRIMFGKSSAKGASYEQLAKTKDGAILRFLDQSPPKLTTQTDLKFGDKVIKRGNVSKDYPGVYALWLKRVGDGWHLVFNNEADVFGTMHDPKADAAEVPITASKSATETPNFTVELKLEGTTGVLRIAWGSQEWTTKFEEAAPPAPEQKPAKPAK